MLGRVASMRLSVVIRFKEDKLRVRNMIANNIQIPTQPIHVTKLTCEYSGEEIIWCNLLGKFVDAFLPAEISVAGNLE